MRIGYARVSTLDQGLALQVESLKAQGCEKIFTDKISGGNMDRPGLREALSYLRKGDTLAVWKLDRLGRSLKNLIEIAELLKSRGVHLYSITDNIDTESSFGRFFFHLMAALAEMERDLIRERTKAGIEVARKKGRVGGRKTVFTPEKKEAAQRLLNSGMTAPDIARTIEVSIATFYRHFPASERS